jgi:hypothetical protein
MRAHQLYQAIINDLQNEIITHLDKEHRPAYRMVLASLAQQRRLRPIFVEKKQRPEQHKFIHEQLRVLANNGVTEQVLQLWLLKSQQAMLKAFLDAVGIEHKDGEVETLPEEISEDKAKAGIDTLLADYPAERVAVYLHMFQMQRPEGWTGLTNAMAAESKLQLAAA